MTEIDAENKMVILHFGGQLAYYVADLPSSEADVTKFVADFHAGKLERKQAVPPDNSVGSSRQTCLFLNEDNKNLIFTLGVSKLRGTPHSSIFHLLNLFTSRL